MTIYKGKVRRIAAPTPIGLLKSVFSSGAVWSITFVCGSCKLKSTVQHNEDKEHHKCPVCGSVNKLDATSWYDL